MRATPTYNKIVVIPETATTNISKGGIIIPDCVEKQQTVVAEVVAVGPGRITENGTLIPCCVKVGDKILMSRFVGFPVEIDGVKYTVTSDVEAVVIFNSDEAKKEQ